MFHTDPRCFHPFGTSSFNDEVELSRFGHAKRELRLIVGGGGQVNDTCVCFYVAKMTLCDWPLINDASLMRNRRMIPHSIGCRYVLSQRQLFI